MNKLAVIISVYKNDQLSAFQSCIYSLLKQTYKDIDIWIQFDGVVSPLIESFLENLNDNRIYIRKRTQNKGLAYSLNELLQEILQIDYQYIARMDADDICFPDRFEQQITYMDKHLDIDISGGYIEEMDEKENSIGIVKYPLIHSEMKDFFGKRNPLAHVSTIFRKSFFNKAGLYPTNTNKDEDTMFWLKGFTTGCVFGNVDRPLVRVRVNDDFYKRRNGFKKSLSDFKNRCLIIRSLKLSYSNYFFAFARFVIFIIPIPKLTQLAYKLLR